MAVHRSGNLHMPRLPLQAYEPGTLLAVWSWTEAAQNMWWHYLVAIVTALFGGLCSAASILRKSIPQGKAGGDIDSGIVSCLQLESPCMWTDSFPIRETWTWLFVGHAGCSPQLDSA